MYPLFNRTEHARVVTQHSDDLIPRHGRTSARGQRVCSGDCWRNSINGKTQPGEGPTVMARTTRRENGARGASAMTSDKVTGKGGCLCGAIRYEVGGPIRQVVNCHCGQCRKFHGHYGAYTNALLDAVTITGQIHIKWFNSSSFARRGFCGICGSSLFWQQHRGDSIYIAAGTLDTPTRLKTIGHVMVAHMGDYYRITDRLKKLPGSSLRRLA